ALEYGDVSPLGFSGAIALSVGDYASAALSVAPAAPADTKATVLATNQIQISWRDNSFTEQGFYLERSVDAQAITWTRIATITTNQTDYIDTNMCPGTIYWYRVQAFNGFGTSQFSTEIEVRATPLDAPYFASAVADYLHSSVQVSWYDTWSGVDGFKIERTDDINSGSWVEIGSVTNHVSDFYTFADTFVPQVPNYWYRVRAFNTLGDSPYSSPAMVTIYLPNDPSMVHAVAFENQITLSWQLFNAEGVHIERALLVYGVPLDYQPLTNITADLNSYVDKGLSPNATYWYRFTAYSWVGVSSSTVISTSIQPPDPPQLNAFVGPSNQLDVVCNQLRQDQDGFVLERAIDDGIDPDPFATRDWIEIATLNATNTPSATYIDTNVVAYGAYWYRARSFNVVGSSFTSYPIKIGALPPVVPVNLSLSTFADKVSLTWFPGDTGVLGFILERAPDLDGSPGTWASLSMLNPVLCLSNSPVTVILTNLQVNVPYWYRVRAFNWIGPSDPGDASAISVLQPNAPDTLVATIGDTNQVNLTWQDSVGDQDGFTVERAFDIDGEPGEWVQIGAVLTNSVNASFTDSNAVANATIWYRIRAFNSLGASDYGDPTYVSLLTPVFFPSLSAAPSDNTVNLTWVEDYNTWVDGFDIERAPDIGGNPGAWIPVVTLYGRIFSYQDDVPDLQINNYWYHIRVFNWLGDSDYGKPVFVNNGAPPQIYSLTVTNNAVLITWSDAGRIDFVQAATCPTGTFLNISPPIVVSHSITNYLDIGALTNSPTRFYRIFRSPRLE
ncbi:MAG TPA: hypothetical protein VH255_09085, partial [Verrucomicrobiae bacterium]|nr:hypothetical protein [Verrucomicrobiae bacterium]